MKVRTQHKQQGIVLLLFVFLLIVFGTTVFVATWNSSKARHNLNNSSAMAMRQAKDVLIAHAITSPDINSTGYLPLPDIGTHIGTPKEGFEAGSFSGNLTDYTAIGKLPWLSLNTQPLYDRHAECLWYAVSGRFKRTPKTGALNWDTQGQVDIIDESGATVATNIVAMVIAPGAPLDGQIRTLTDSAYTKCGGNYKASHYLDPGDPSNALAGQINYFASSTNNRVASDTGNKTFVMTTSHHFNDQFLLITIDDIFRPIMRRSDFSAQINNLLNDSALSTHVQGLLIAGPKGTDNLDCAAITGPFSSPPALSIANESFCKNWKEMLFVTQLPSPPSPSTCNRVIIFAGQKKTGQNRTTLAEKLDKANYLEEPNLSAFNTPVASSNVFGSMSIFSADQPWVDIVKCVPTAP